MFSHNRNLAVFGGNFTQVSSQGARGIDQLYDASSPSAVHNSGERFPPPKCHENTRVAVINRIMRWILGHEEREALIMWLLGPAGAGKSAIAQTLAELCHSLNILLATFFFFRTDPNRNHSQSLFSTIAYQVAINFPDAREYVERVPETDPMIFTRSIEEQFSSLIIKPLQELYHSGRPTGSSDPYLIIIDGLDECADSAMQVSLLQVISKALSESKLPLKFLIASRPEVHLMSGFNSRIMNPILARLALDDHFIPKDDIRRFLQDKFEEIKQTHPLASLINPSWPSADNIEHLVHKSSGQFIFASTVIKYISFARRLPTISLEVILGLRPSNMDTPFAELDALYLNILSSVTDIEKTLTILGFLIFSGDTYSRSKLIRTDFSDDFLMLSEGDSLIFCADLASVLIVEQGGFSRKRFDLLHASLSDFLLDRSRSNQFALDPAEVHAQLSCMCFRALRRFLNLRANTCNIPVITSRGYQYACECLTMHCSAAAPTAALQNAILGFSDNSHPQYQRCHSYPYSAFIALEAIRATSFGPEIVSPHLTIFENFLLEQLPKCYSDPILTFLLATIPTLRETHTLSLVTDEVAEFFRVPQASGLDGICLHLLSLFSSFASSGRSIIYRKFLARFLTTESRSRHCFLNKQRYSIAAQQCLQYLHRKTPYLTPEPGLSLTAWTLHFLPTLLDRSSETEELIRSAQNIDFNSESGDYPAAESAAKAAIARYLSRCTKTARRLPRRKEFYLVLPRLSSKAASRYSWLQLGSDSDEGIAFAGSEVREPFANGRVNLAIYGSPRHST